MNIIAVTFDGAVVALVEDRDEAIRRKCGAVWNENGCYIGNSKRWTGEEGKS